MAFELKGVLEFIGIDAKDMDDLKTKFTAKWHTPDTFFTSKEFGDKIGQINGSLVSKTKAISKTFGIELTGKDIEGKKVEEIYELTLQRLQEQNNTALEAAKTAAAGSKDDTYKALETKYNTTIRDFQTIEETNKKLKTDLETATANFNTQLKGEKLSFREKGLYDSFKWGTDDELRRKGFISTVSEKVKFDLDENDNMIVVDRKTGQKIPNPKVASTFLSPQEYLEKEGRDAKILQINKDGGKQAGEGAGASPGWSSTKKEEGGEGGQQTQRTGNILAATTYHPQN